MTNLVNFWGCVLFAKLCQMSGQQTGARVLILLAAGLIAVEIARLVRDRR